ncbi:hypothetical protein DL240_04160 [Lujinxingia litoralis]|uniref:FHA domain-containing protein n=1 Tax=Lujinxingia litoralis TaxID=2211119 RepID=A0A328CEM5_9DELT|nr:FHA domain-containing protein [Lujinxingia litoralis]RAL25413.1 hypothetical protein DL240_04160 [Lujinxingia litoralis]
MIICKSCGRENEDEFKFCLGCGSALEAPKPEPKVESVDCPHCGAMVPGGFKFCGACGGSLHQQVKTPSAGDALVGETMHTGGPRPSSAEIEESPRRLGELTVIRPDGSEGARIELTTSGVMLGRKNEHEVLANDPFLSPEHASVSYESGRVILRDLDSINGVFWRLRDDVELQSGDLIRVGQELLRFDRAEDVAALPTEAKHGDPEVERQGSPERGVWGRLALIGGPDVETRAFEVHTSEVTLGREVGTILFRDDGFVSGKHARIYKDQERVYLRDLGSSNGTYIKVRGERQLSNGDLILMGQQLFRLQIG